MSSIINWSWFDRAPLWSRMYNLEWQAEMKKPKASLARTILRLFGFELLPLILVEVITKLIFSALRPLMLANMIRFFSDPSSEDYGTAWLSCVVMLASGAIRILLNHPQSILSERWIVRVSIALRTVIYRKTLRLNPSAFHHTTVGQILNLITDDAYQFDGLPQVIGFFVSTPISIVVGTYLCYGYLGGATFLGLSIMIILVPVNRWIGKAIRGFYRERKKKTDHRVNLMTEIVKFMRIIKMYAWEDHFHKLISKARREEMAQVTKIKHFNMVYSAVWRLVMPLTIFTMLVVYALQGHSLNAHKVYAVITIFQSMVSEINWLFGGGLEYFSQLRTGCKRVQTFLMLEEIGENRQNVHDSNYSRSDSVTTHPIVVDRATIQWQMSQHKFALDEISLRVKRGELLTVIGTVGSGKSTFLASLLNEPSIVSGSVSIAGKVAYASQEPWCFNDTIEANILFGQSLDPNRLNQVIEACALRVDLESMPHREKTLVGERGMILSGGQKARVALARALYSDADIYLLDDPLSAVDAEVAKHIFEQCIEGYLRDKTVVLVTHQVQFIKNSSKILVLDKGQPLAYGTYEHVLQSDSKLLDFIRHVSSSETKESKSTLKNNSNLNNSPEKNNDSGPKIVPENMQSGAVGFETYRRYFKSGASWPLMAGAVGGILVGQVVYHWSDLWLVQWTNAVDLKVHTDVIFNAVVYFLLLISDFLCHILKSLSLHAMCIKASTSLHDRVFEALMRARIAFFDKNPAGRILDRFTKDLRVADVAFENTFDASIRTFLKIVGSVTLISYFRWQLIAPAVMVLALAYYLRTFYAQPSRDLKRMESSLRSPVLNHAHLTLGGLSIIRAFQAECLVTEQFYRFQNDFSNGSFIRWSFSNLFSMIVNWFCHFYVLCTAIALMVFYGDIKSGTAGLILTMAFGLIGPIQYSVRRSVQLESEMTSVERLEEYTKLEPEGPLETNYRLPENWPSSGRIEFDHVSLSYDGENDVLKDLTFEVRGGEKVSIVGRTGAGKSSVLAALFRMVEVRGRVAIDGVPSNALGLNQLRSALAIIPQEPMAFVGSVRTNLDPLSCHSDGELWQALRSVQLESTVEQWEGQLDYELSEGGTNLSVGQRQLVCLARALLRGNQILVLDEATANVDHHTDQLIQGTIRKCFAHCTVITIAHRLHTIIDSNRVLVLDAGRLVQFDTPHNLLAAKTGIFYNLVQQTGPEMAAKLENAVFNADHKNGLFN